MRGRLKVLLHSAMLLLLLGMLRAQVPSASPAPEPAKAATAKPLYAIDPHFVAAWSEASELYRHHSYRFAADAYKKANKLSGGQCMECLGGRYRSQMAMGDHKGASSTAEEMEPLATSAGSKALAIYYRAEVLYVGAGEKPKPEKLDAAHGLLQEALVLAPKFGAALYLDGRVLAALGKMEDARAAFTACAACVSPKDPARIRAQHFAENPELSTHKMAPPFEVTALDGTRLNLDAMSGRVVLIDFWATWCGPCNRELPHMKKLAQEFAGEPLVILSVSWDADEAKWKDFIARNGMTWPQYRDADHKLSDMFGIDAIPHYFTIDSDGVLTAEMVGEGSDVEGKLRKLLAKAREAGKPVTLASQASSRPGDPGSALR